MDFVGVVKGFRLTDARNQDKEEETVIEMKILIPYSREAHSDAGALYRSTVAGTLRPQQGCLGFE